MTRAMICLSAAMLFLSPPGCRRESEPPPRMVGGRPLLPVRVSESVHDRSIIAPVTAARVEAKPSEAEKPAPADATAGADQVLEAMRPVLDAFTKLDKIAKEKFPDFTSQEIGPFPHFGTQINLVGMEPVNDEEAAAIIETVVVVNGQEQTKTEKLTIRKIDGHWRIESPETADLAQAQDPAELEKMAQVADKMAEAIETQLIAKLESNEIADENALKQVIDKAMSGAIMGPANQPAADGESPPPSPEAAPPAQPETRLPPNPAPRQPDEVDGTYSGPGMLRSR